MINLRNAIMKKLKEFHPVAYSEQAPKKANFPYVVYSFPNSFSKEGQEVFILDIDIWDNQEDTTALETLASSVWKGLNRLHYIDENIQFSIYQSSRLPELEDDNPAIKRRKLIFELKYFERELI